MVVVRRTLSTSRSKKVPNGKDEKPVKLKMNGGRISVRLIALASASVPRNASTWSGAQVRRLSHEGVGWVGGAVGTDLVAKVALARAVGEVPAVSMPLDRDAVALLATAHSSA